MAAGGSSAKVGTAYEQLIGKLMDGEGDPGKARVAILARVGERWLGNCWSGTQRKHYCTLKLFQNYLSHKMTFLSQTAGPLSLVKIQS